MDVRLDRRARNRWRGNSRHDAPGLAPARLPGRLGRSGSDVAIRAEPEPFNQATIVVQARAKEMNHGSLRRSVGRCHGCRCLAISFVPSPENDGEAVCNGPRYRFIPRRGASFPRRRFASCRTIRGAAAFRTSADRDIRRRTESSADTETSINRPIRHPMPGWFHRSAIATAGPPGNSYRSRQVTNGNLEDQNTQDV